LTDSRRSLIRPQRTKEETKFIRPIFYSCLGKSVFSIMKKRCLSVLIYFFISLCVWSSFLK